jgi:osmotically-inducible protein OsmY
MIFLNHLITLICAVLLVSILGCFSTSKKEEINNQEITGSYIDDSAITAKVKAAIFQEPSLKSDEIGVETIRGTVRLTGFVSSIIVMEKTIEIARGVKGVRAVKDEMRLKGQH